MVAGKMEHAFEVAYEDWMLWHSRDSSGERKRKLAEGLNHASKSFVANVWWPAFSSLSGLSPEYETKDFKDGYRYLDFSWTMPTIKVAIEIDGFGPHWRNVDRWKFADHLFRQNHLVLDGWAVLRFSYDDIAEHPRRCQQILMHAAGKWGLSHTAFTPGVEDPVDRSILWSASRSDGLITPSAVAQELGWHRATVARRMNRLAKAGLLVPAKADSLRNRGYFYIQKEL